MRHFLLFISLLLLPVFSKGQDIHFSQTVRAGFQLNPAFVGAFDGNFQITANWKDQWQSVNKTFRTYAASAQVTFGKGNPKVPVSFGLGGYAYRDVSGDVQLGNTSGGINIGSLVKISHNARLILGFQGGYSSFGINASNMQWGSQYNGLNFDPALANGDGIEIIPFNYVDMSAGLGLWWRKQDRNVAATSAQDVRFGVAVYHLNKPYYSYAQTYETRLPMRFVVNLSTLLKTRWENLYWYPNVTANNQGQQHEILFGSLWKYRMRAASKSTGYISETSVTMGADLRVTNVIDAIVPQLFLNMFNVSVGVSYDVNVSNFRTASQYRGGIELSLRFTNPDQYIHRNPFRDVPSI